jgi:histidine triad (HIT) family protein
VTVASISNDCEFCAIARGETQATIVVAESRCLAFIPKEPATRGHTLVIPRRHVSDLWSIEDDQLLASLMAMVIRVGRALGPTVQPEGMNLITSAGAAASQTVFHLHLHVVPRWLNDRMGDIWPEDGLPLESQAHELANALRRAYNAQG